MYGNKDLQIRGPGSVKNIYGSGTVQSEDPGMFFYLLGYPKLGSRSLYVCFMPEKLVKNRLFVF